MSAVRFFVPGRIGGKGRPRMVVINGHARAVTPSKTRATEAMVREIAANAMFGNTFDGPLLLEIKVDLNKPKSWPKKKRESTKYATGKPDCDNQIKLISDALNGIVYRDDSQIAQIVYERRYREDRNEGVWVYVGELK